MARKTGVFGDAETARALRNLAKGIPAKDIDTAAIVSMNPMLQDTRSGAQRHRNYAGKHPGFPNPKPGRDHVDEGIVVRRTTSTKTRRSFWLGAVGRARRILHLLEFGSAPHWQPKFKGGFMHPGAKAKPVMTPAYERHADDVAPVFGRVLWRGLQQRVNSLASRVKKP